MGRRGPSGPRLHLGAPRSSAGTVGASAATTATATDPDPWQIDPREPVDSRIRRPPRPICWILHPPRRMSPVRSQSRITEYPAGRKAHALLPWGTPPPRQNSCRLHRPTQGAAIMARSASCETPGHWEGPGPNRQHEQHWSTRGSYGSRRLLGRRVPRLQPGPSRPVGRPVACTLPRERPRGPVVRSHGGHGAVHIHALTARQGHRSGRWPITESAVRPDFDGARRLRPPVGLRGPDSRSVLQHRRPQLRGTGGRPPL